MIYLHKAEKKTLCSIFCSQGLQPSSAMQLVEALAHWEKHHGIKWVMDRLKHLRRSLQLKTNEGIRCHKDGSWYGVLKPIHRLASRGRSGAVKADRILRVYSRWFSPSPTKEDYILFEANLNANARLDCKPATDLPLQVRKADIKLANRVFRESGRFNLDYPSSATRKVPFIGKLEIDTLPHEHYLELLWQCPSLALKHQSFIVENVYDVTSFSPLGNPSPGSTWTKEQMDDDEFLRYDIGGKIACLTKDGGLKKRFIANPHRFLQLMTSRLQQTLDSYLKVLPESLVHTQHLSEEWVSRQFIEGKTVYSLDLSSATDHFPKKLQFRIMRQLFPMLSEDISIWEDISNLLWETPYGDHIRYEVGQPMGTAPSFAAFTVAHIHLVRWIGGNADNFRVIGDDIVINNKELAERYINVMKQLGVTVSLNKSLFSDSVAEFAGRTIDRHGYWGSFKARPFNLVEDPLGPYRQYGPAASKLVPAHHHRICKEVIKLPYIGPRSCWDYSILEKLDDASVLSLYTSKPELFPKKSNFRKDHIWVTPLDVFEKIHVKSGFRGRVRVTNPDLIVDHVNANLLSDGFLKTPQLRYMATALHRGAAEVQGSIYGPKIHMNHIKRMAKILSRS